MRRTQSGGSSSLDGSWSKHPATATTRRSSLVDPLLREARPQHWLYDGRGLRAGASLGDRVRPDGVLAPKSHFTGYGEWSNPDGVLMTVEVTSRVAESNSRARVSKRESYAAAGIPVYLLIDRDNCSATVHSEPREGAYRHAVTAAYGEDLQLPDPVNAALRTERLVDPSS